MSHIRRYLCGTPEHKCTGSFTSILDSKWTGSHKAHTTREDAFSCYAQYLIDQGYTRLGIHEFQAPNGGPILLLNRLSQFGGELRRGKGDRVMPDRGGIIF